MFRLIRISFASEQEFAGFHLLGERGHCVDVSPCLTGAADSKLSVDVTQMLNTTLYDCIVRVV